MSDETNTTNTTTHTTDETNTEQPTNLPSAHSPLTLAQQQALHVSSIRTHVPIELNLTDSNYNKWRELFLVTLGKFGLRSHIDGNPAPATPLATDSSWVLLDFVVLSWIYASIHSDIFDIVVKPNASASSIWIATEQLFRDNKKTRAIQLQQQFRSLVQENLSITEYCQKLKTLADALQDVDSPISDENLVLQTLQGLNDNYQTMASLITHQTPFPTFQATRSSLLLEESRRNKPSPISTALVSSSDYTSSPSPLKPTQAPLPAQSSSFNSYRGRGSRFRGRGRSRHGGRSWSSWNQQWNGPTFGQQWPTQSPTPPPWNPSSGILGPGPRPQQALTAQWDQQALVNTLNNMTLQQPQDGWYMDSGASSHMTSMAGSSYQGRDNQIQ